MVNNPKNKDFLKKLGKIGVGLFSVSRHSSRPQNGRASWRTENKFHAILAVIILLAVFIPQHFVLAEGCDIWGFSLTDCAIAIANIPLFIIAWLLSFVAGLLNDFIRAGAVRISAVEQSWTIMRDFVNLFFILVLIIMAFGTIFSIQKYTWKQMLAPFLIAALLINFSFAIGVYVISLGNGLSNVFLNMIGTINLADRIGDGLGMQKLITTEGRDLTGSAITAVGFATLSALRQLVTIVFFTIFGAIALLAMIAAAIFVLIRIPILWMFLIVSPIAWFGYALPNLRAQTWSKWWHGFLQWVFFLPVYLFFLMFGFIFIAAKSSTGQLAASVTLGQNALLFVNDIVFFAVTLIFMVGGLWASFKVGGLAGSSAGKLMGKIETGVRKYAPGAAYVRARYTGAKEGLAERGKEIEEKGLFGIGGAQRERLRAAETKGWIAGIPGPGRIPGAREEISRAKSAEVDREVKRLQTLNLTLDQLNERLTKASGPEKIAAFKLKAESGWLEATDLNETNSMLDSAGGGRTALGASIIQSLKKGKFHEMAQTTAQKEFIFDNLEDAEVRKAFGLDMAESRELMSTDVAKKLLDLYGSDTKEVKDKVEKAVKDNIENMARDEAARKDFLAGTSTFAGADIRLRKLAAQTIVDKKEVSSWKMRRQILELNGGIDPSTGDAKTADGRKLASDIKDSNIVFKEEADYRKANPATSYAADLGPTQLIELENQIVDNIKTGLIRNLSTEELKSPAIFNALFNGRTSGLITAEEYNKALGLVKDKRPPYALEIKGKPDRKKRKAINDILTATAPMPY